MERYIDGFNSARVDFSRGYLIYPTVEDHVEWFRGYLAGIEDIRETYGTEAVCTALNPDPENSK